MWWHGNDIILTHRPMQSGESFDNNLAMYAQWGYWSIAYICPHWTECICQICKINSHLHLHCIWIQKTRHSWKLDHISATFSRYFCPKQSPKRMPLCLHLFGTSSSSSSYGYVAGCVCHFTWAIIRDDRISLAEERNWSLKYALTV